MTRPTYYEILGVSSTASADQISRSYDRAIRRYQIDCAEATTNVFAAMVREAYEVLNDEERRRWYDSENESLASGESVVGASDIDDFPARAGVADRPSARPDNWLFVGWWAYSTAVLFLGTIALAVAMDTPIVPGSDPVGLLGLGACTAVVALVGALVSTRTLRLQLGFGAVLILTSSAVFLTSLVVYSDARFLLPVMFTFLLAAGSLIVAWRRRLRRGRSPAAQPA